MCLTLISPNRVFDASLVPETCLEHCQTSAFGRDLSAFIRVSVGSASPWSYDKTQLAASGVLHFLASSRTKRICNRRS
jgi:hypothetical protein